MDLQINCPRLFQDDNLQFLKIGNAHKIILKFLLCQSAFHIHVKMMQCMNNINKRNIFYFAEYFGVGATLQFIRWPFGALSRNSHYMWDVPVRCAFPIVKITYCSIKPITWITTYSKGIRMSMLTARDCYSTFTIF